MTQELGITVENEDEDERSADIFTRSRIRNDQVTIKPLMQRKLGKNWRFLHIKLVIPLSKIYNSHKHIISQHLFIWDMMHLNDIYW
jgi:hypothetical protein